MSVFIAVLVGLVQPMTSEAQRERIIFAAQKFGENHGNVYESGGCHLYSLGLDGSDLKQVTSGPFTDQYPVLAKDGKRILFWRSREKSDSDDRTVMLCEVNADGTGLHIIGRRQKDGHSNGLAHAVERTALGLQPRLESIKSEKWEVFHDSDTITYSPKGTRVLTYLPRPNSEGFEVWVGDLRTRKVARINDKYQGVTWLGDETLVVSVGTSTSELAILDWLGRPIDSVEIADKDEYPDGYPLSRQAFKLGNSGVFLLQFHHSMSDGGYYYSDKVNLNKHLSHPFLPVTIEGVSPDGGKFVTSELGWVGGYKGPGAAKLCRVSLWDTRSWSSKRIGFRKMFCFGACFVPR